MPDPLDLKRIAVDALALCATPDDFDAVAAYLHELADRITQHAERNREALAAVSRLAMTAPAPPPNA
jgi:hypothetical protein